MRYGGKNNRLKKDMQKKITKKLQRLAPLLKNKIVLLVIAIFIVATLLRFYNFYQGWEIGGDAARDISIAQEAIIRRELPLIGPFSSAGPFVSGPLYYWFIILSFVLFPFSLMTPWVATAIVGLFTIGILMYCAKLIGGTRLAIFTGILSATSPQLVIHSLVLNNPTFVIICASLLLLNFILLYQTKKILFAIFMGLSIGTGISMHYQALNLLLFLPTVLFVPETTLKKKIVFLVAVIIGVLLPSLPLLYWDFQQQFANIRNILDYFLIAQHRIYVPNSWRLFLLEYLPIHWSFMIGGYPFIGGILAFITGFFFVVFFARKKISRILFILGLLLGMFLVLNKYYKGERTEGYMLYLLPFILLFNAWAITLLTQPKSLLELFSSKARRFIYPIFLACGYGLLSIVLVGNLLIVKELKDYHSNIKQAQKVVDILITKFPNKYFYLYDYQGKSFSEVSSLVVFLENKGRITKKGMPIGFIPEGQLRILKRPLPVLVKSEKYMIVDIKNELVSIEYTSNWQAMNQTIIYDRLIGWSKRHELTSSFSLIQFIKDKTGIK